MIPIRYGSRKSQRHSQPRKAKGAFYVSAEYYRATLLNDPVWDLLFKIVTVAGPIVLGLLGAWNAWQGQRISTLTNGREQDRKDREELRENAKYWHDETDRTNVALDKLRVDNQALNSSYVALSTRHEETRSQLAIEQTGRQDLNVRFEKRVVELDQLRADMSKQASTLALAQTTIDSLNNALLKERSDYDDALTRMNDDHMSKQDTLQKQIDRLSADLKSANDKITDLHRQLQDFNSVNMQLARKLEDMTDERDRLLDEKAVLQGQLAALRTPAPQPEPPEPTPPTTLTIVDGETGDVLKEAA